MKSALIGIVAAIPPLAFFIWTLNLKLRLLSHHQNLLESLLRPFFGRWSVVQLLAISLIAGISEEAFFRAAIQGSLADGLDVILALALASGLSGACHLLTWTYAIIAAFIGAYLGLLWIWTGNLLNPMVKEPKKFTWYESDHVGIDREHTIRVLEDGLKWLLEQDNRFRATDQSTTNPPPFELQGT